MQRSLFFLPEQPITLRRNDSFDWSTVPTTSTSYRHPNCTLKNETQKHYSDQPTSFNLTFIIVVQVIIGFVMFVIIPFENIYCHTKQSSISLSFRQALQARRSRSSLWFFWLRGEETDFFNKTSTNKKYTTYLFQIGLRSKLGARWAAFASSAKNIENRVVSEET